MATRTAKIHGDDRRRAATLMKRILLGFRAQMDEELKPRGVRTAQVQILKAVQSSPGSSGAHLARVCYMTPQSMQSLIEKTERDGWIVRRKGKENDRVLAAWLTEAGEALLSDAEVVVKRIERRLWDGVSADEVTGLVGLLERCLGNIEE
jgi:DNA-binding MarR family transcriptional regulator